MNVVFSYDCEGNWGFVDWKDVPFEAQRHSDLQQIYKKLVRLHLKYDIPATFAFVGFYCMTSTERSAYIRESLSGSNELPLNIHEHGGCWEGAENLAIVNDSSSDGISGGRLAFNDP